MTALPIFRRALADSWRSLLGWGVGMAGVLFLYLPLYPSVGADGQMQGIIDSMPPELVQSLGFDQIATGAGYASATFFGLIGFALLVIASATWGTAAIAGDEEKGGLELTLAHGVGRVQLVLERTLAILVRLAALGALVLLLVLALNEPSELGIEPGNIPAMVVSYLGAGFLTAGIALAAGAITGRATIATLAAAGVAVAGYALNAVANQSADLDGLRAFSPYAWALGGEPLADGWDLAGLALTWGIGAALVAVAAVALARRDLAS